MPDFFGDDALRARSHDRNRIWTQIELIVVYDHDGWVVSPAFAWPMRIECPPGSTLPEALRAEGFSVVNAGCIERFRPFTEVLNGQPVQHLAQSPIDIWELRLP
jgi:hypothetical protein